MTAPPPPGDRPIFRTVFKILTPFYTVRIWVMVGGYRLLASIAVRISENNFDLECMNLFYRMVGFWGGWGLGKS